jgi:hypothetical protein
MAENEALGRAPNNQQSPENKTNTEKTAEEGPTEKLREQAKPQAEHLVPGAGVPGVQKPDTQELKEETNPNTE